MRNHSNSLATMHSPYVYALGWSQFTELFKSSRCSSESRVCGIESLGENAEYPIEANIEDLLLRKAMSNRLGIELDNDELGDIARDINARSIDVCMAAQSWQDIESEGDASADADYTLELSLLESVGDIARELAAARESQLLSSQKSETAKP